MGDLSWWHWLIVVLVFVLLFGSKRLPDAARALGKSMRILKTEVKGLHDDDDEATPSMTPPQALPTAAPQPPPTTVPSTPTTTAAAPPVTDSSDSR
jgi:sec-independent protein translocase protein TatA